MEQWELTVTKHSSISKILPQSDFIVIVLIKKLHEIIWKHAGFACWRYCTMPPAARLDFNICYHRAFHKIQLIQLASGVIEFHYCTDCKEKIGV